MKQPLIDIVYLDGMTAQVTNDMLDILIATGKILRFRREDGWVEIDASNTQLRDYRRNGDPARQERRSPWPNEHS